MCPLLSVRLSVCPSVGSWFSRICMCAAPSPSGSTPAPAMPPAPATAIVLTAAMGLSPRVHVLTVAWRRFELYSLS